MAKFEISTDLFLFVFILQNNQRFTLNLWLFIIEGGEKDVHCGQNQYQQENVTENKLDLAISKDLCQPDIAETQYQSKGQEL